MTGLASLDVILWQGAYYSWRPEAAAQPSSREQAYDARPHWSYTAGAICHRTERMGISELLRWQWAGYAKYHQSRANLLIHIIAVPLFLIGTIALVVALSQLSLMLLAVGVGCIVVAVALQGRGHRLEVVPPEPFSGPLNFVSRLFLEQWVTFPRFVISGGWGASLRKVREP